MSCGVGQPESHYEIRVAVQLDKTLCLSKNVRHKVFNSFYRSCINIYVHIEAIYIHTYALNLLCSQEIFFCCK